MCKFLKKLFGLEKGESKEGKITKVKCIGERKCLYIVGKKDILILPDTILHIRMSSPIHKNACEYVDITGRFVNCTTEGKNKWTIVLDTSARCAQDSRCITIYPKSWDGYTDVWVNGFHIDYSKVGNDNYIRIEERVLYLLSYNETNKLFLTNLEGTFMFNGRDEVGRIVSCEVDPYDYKLHCILDCSSKYKRDVESIPLENLDSVIPLTTPPTCILTDSDWNKDYKENAAVMDTDIATYLDENIDKLRYAFM